MGDWERIRSRYSIGAILLFLLRFIAASALLYLLYRKLGSYYVQLLSHGAEPLLSIFGHSIDIDRALLVTEDISLNTIVFLSLVIASAGTPALARLRSALSGLAILTAANILVVFLMFLSVYEKSERLWTGTEFMNLTINFFLPILLWFMLIQVKSIRRTDPS